MSNPNDGGPAFPNDISASTKERGGMTLRDYFAATELSKKDAADCCDIPAAYERLADHCYSMADAMLAARERQS